MPLSPHVPDLTALDLFVAVARLGSIGAAAREAGISQQAASARLAAMEAQVGTALLARDPRGSRVTAAGALLADWAAPLLALAGELDTGIASLRRERDAQLRVASSLTIAEHLLPGWLATLATEAHPIEVRLDVAGSSVVAQGVADGRSEIGFVEGHKLPAGLSSQVLGHDRLVVVVGPSHPWSHRRRPLRPAELATAALIGREEGSGTKETLAVALQRAGVGPPSEARAEVASLAALRALLRSGQGASALSELAVADDLRAGRLVEVPTVGVDLSRSLRAVWKRGASLGTPASALLAVAMRWGRGAGTRS